MTRHEAGHLKDRIARNLRDAAKAKGLSQRKIADAVGATPAQVSHWMRGTYTPRDYLFKLAELLFDGDLSALYREPDDEPDPVEARAA
jgi:transcriptional regulator with XRE-family HTH domain